MSTEGAFPFVSGRGMKLAIHTHLLRRLRMSGSINTFHVEYRKYFTFTFTQLVGLK